MSELTSPIRTARPAVGAVERARLALVPVRTVRAPRAPFAVLVFLILGAGVVGLLMFNTTMQQDSIYATQLQQRADALTAEREALGLELDRLRDPQRLAAAGRSLGMVPSKVPAFVSLADGKVLGTPTPARAEDAERIYPLPARLPAPLRPKPLTRFVIAKADPAAAKKADKPGRASTDGAAAAGTNGAGSAAQGATR